MPNKKRDRRNQLDPEEREEQENEHQEQVEPTETALPAERLSEQLGEAPTAHVQANWEDEKSFPLSDETVSDFIEVGVDPEAVMAEIEQHTLDIEVQEDFEERQNIAIYADELKEDLEEYTHQSPKLSGGDVDAAWEDSDQVGEESVGASVPTPDQDVVDELGEAVGITYDDDEELATAEKLGERDLNRWELNPASASDFEIETTYGRTEDILDLRGEMGLGRVNDELDSLLEEEDLDELEELRDTDVDPLDLDDVELEDFDDEDLELFDKDFDELDDEDNL